MKALKVSAQGRPGEVLVVRDIDRPAPGPGEVRVKVGAASLNFNDITDVGGRWFLCRRPPFTLGMDVCGMVEATGERAESWLGNRVVAITKNALGGLAEYAIADAVSTLDAPERFDDAQGGAFELSLHASHLALFHRGRLRAGETLVVHSAASELGSAESRWVRQRMLESSPWPVGRRRARSALRSVPTSSLTTRPGILSNPCSSPPEMSAPTSSTTLPGPYCRGDGDMTDRDETGRDADLRRAPPGAEPGG